jgi:hypothetical protein
VCPIFSRRPNTSLDFINNEGDFLVQSNLPQF